MISTNQAGHRRGTHRETPTASNLVVAMSADGLRLYSQIPAEIGLKTSYGATTSTIREAGNAVYFTLE